MQRAQAHLDMMPKVPPPCLLVIFGASGDLTHRKLVPALFDLYCAGQLSERFAVLGISRTPMSSESFRDRLAASGALHDRDATKWAAFARCLHYHAGDPTSAEAYPPIKQQMAELAGQHATGGNVLFYLAVAPQIHEPLMRQLAAAGMVDQGRTRTRPSDHRPWQRLIVEKPFGFDTDSAAQLQRAIGSVFPERCIYRIDHFLGKEMVQNLLVFRFANAIFEPIWNQHYIDNVQLTAAETVGVEGRGSYYDSHGGGALRDMIQSHLLQVMALVAMEPPVSMSAADVRNEKTKVLAATAIVRPDQVPQMAVRGQYGPGQVAGQAVAGYRSEPGIDPASQTETYATLRLSIDTWRWGGVPFYLRCGKRMARKLTEVVVTFKQTPHCLFKERARSLRPNQIVVNLQPDEGISLRFAGKVPGAGMSIRDVVMDFDYIEHFHAEPPDAYTALLLEAMRGDQTLFKHRDQAAYCWGIVQPILDWWHAEPPEDFPNYAASTWGPSSSDVMLGRDNRQWHQP